MEKQKSVTIKETLFMDLVKYFLVNVREDEDRIRLELHQKLDALVKRELYTKYKTAKSAEEREAARQEYLEKVGMPKGFRWQFFADYNNKLVTRVCYDDRYKNNGQGSRDVPCKSINRRVFWLMCMGVDTSCVSCGVFIVKYKCRKLQNKNVGRCNCILQVIANSQNPRNGQHRMAAPKLDII